jgi:glycerol-3-phosphate acyltransferase PlsY
VDGGIIESVTWVLVAALIGSASAGDLVPRLWGVNIRERGDHNPGTRNVLREVGPIAAVLVLAFDVATGAAATVVPLLLGWSTGGRAAAMVAVLLGHIFTPWWRFRGGVGGAVAIGTTFGLLPRAALIAGPIALATVGATRTSIYAVWTFFGLCIAAGLLIDRDPAGVAAVLVAMLTPTARWASRYGITNRDALSRWRREHGRFE